MAAINAWISIGSTYSYLAVERLPALAREKGHRVVWRAFNIRQLLQRLGYTPFAGKPNKLAYMWRDLERRAARHGISWARAPAYPLPELLTANAVSFIAEQEGWIEEYLRACYRGWFLDGLRPGEADNLQQSLAAAGQSYEQVMKRAASDTIREGLAKQTDEADALGVFGSPSFIVNGELFWGDDRLEEALDWADGRRPGESGNGR